MDKENPSNGTLHPGVSVRMGPVEDMDVNGEQKDAAHVNGAVNGKRKSRTGATNGKSYREASSSDEDDEIPLVRPYPRPPFHTSAG